MGVRQDLDELDEPKKAVKYEIYYTDEKNEVVVLTTLDRGELSKEKLDEICSWNTQVYGENLVWRLKK